MTDRAQIESAVSREIPIIPPNGEVKDWKHVYFHYANYGSVIQILHQGIWSVAFSHLVKQPIEPSGFSPVQQEIGWDYISVYDADDPGVLLNEVLPGRRMVTFVLKKIHHKSSPTVAERMMPGEHSVHWRVAPRDIVAMWVNKGILDMPLSEFLDDYVEPEMYKQLRTIFNRMTGNNSELRQKMIQIGDEELKKANEKYPGAYWQMIGRIAQENQTKHFAREWIADIYNVNPDEQKVIELLHSIEKTHGIKIYSVATDEDSPRATPIS